MENKDEIEIVPPTQQNEQVANANSEEYNSADIFLEIAENEFNREDERANKLHAKAGILLSVIAVLFTFYMPTMQVKEISQFPATTFIEWLPLFILLAFYVVTALSSLLSLVFLISVIYTASYERFDYNDLCKDSNLRAARDIARVALTQKYCEMAKKNSFSNDKKAKRYKRGSICLVIALICVVITAFYASFAL